VRFRPESWQVLQEHDRLDRREVRVRQAALPEEPLEAQEVVAHADSVLGE
jgi:hypothetical protein